MSNVVVIKFGGASLATPERIRAAADRVFRWNEEGWHAVVVVSACGTTTDRILEWLRNATGRSTVTGREADRALATGETLAAGLLAAALEARGVASESLGAAEAGILGTGSHGHGHITFVRAGALRRRLEAGVAPVVTGFQCVDSDGNLLTLGRGGSDVTAVHLAAALGAHACHLVKDVSGIHERDPREDPSARLLTRLHPRELGEIVLSGAHVVHPDAVRLAEERDVPLRVYGFQDPTFGNHGSTVVADSASRCLNPVPTERGNESTA